jgi:hypothetical protein
MRCAPESSRTKRRCINRRERDDPDVSGTSLRSWSGLPDVGKFRAELSCRRVCKRQVGKRFPASALFSVWSLDRGAIGWFKSLRVMSKETSVTKTSSGSGR